MFARPSRSLRSCRMIGNQEAVQWFSLIVSIACHCVATSERPHIVFILADDLGWNDVGFHGSGQVPTPNIDALAYSGIILDKYYVSPICTPSRSALMTGKHPINIGMQHGVLKCAEPRGLPLREKLLPEYLRELGYNTHIVGKWHLGFYTKEYTPTYRGFDSHLGFWSGHQDYFDHTAVESPYWGLDMRRGLEPAWDLHGQYSTDIFTREAEKLIDAHNTSRPMFLYLAHAAVHSGNPYNPLPAPDPSVARFSDIRDYNRRRYAGMLAKLDESVGLVVEALRKKQMLENSIIVFSTDNGGPPAGFNLNAASNWPLRGAKNTLWEGGVRGAGFIWSAKLLPEPGRLGSQMFHVTDWLPTLLDAAGGNPWDLSIDGMNLWDALKNNDESPRKTVLHNIDNIYGISAITHRDYKLIKGSTYEGQWDGWYGPSGREWAYDVPRVISSLAGRAVASIGLKLAPKRIRELQSSVMVKCPPRNETLPPCKPLKAPCLFDIRRDPCEGNNIAKLFPEIVNDLWEEIQRLNDSSVHPGNLPWDQKANPVFWDHTWTNFGDHLNSFEASLVGAM
ncbi:arylsulfatase B [Nomia melanderi]|uniref:arylsulfatase B n=1 Tax=Nomia melanderi TaxID=2448451 RepID=UPI0013046EF5|nr:arylsulfatase B [Nomia melanderi]XP_031839750.1 arylsulfatase B [Nomia melanderi]XP_031839752.1 arylsulfatase B [Nomia melanderi]XP_031839753.1 arylsulfatase B [Nomia melanderi]XP_031839754.1 arylsulfatase B [Nomia melanderi]XP_031839755.1 arylsulfatase B [Nomia melanderi]